MDTGNRPSLLEKPVNDTSFREKERIRFNAYRAKKKGNQSEVEEITQPEKERLRKQKYMFKKIKCKC